MEKRHTWALVYMRIGVKLLLVAQNSLLGLGFQAWPSYLPPRAQDHTRRYVIVWYNVKFKMILI